MDIAMLILTIISTVMAVASFIVSLILARFNSKLYAYLEDKAYIKDKYDVSEILGVSFTWPLFPLFFIVLSWNMLLNKISK